jgi:hypothetical protein
MGSDREKRMRIPTGLTLLIAAASLGLTGCVTVVATYQPSPSQQVVYTDGIGEIRAETDSAAFTIYPTFKYQGPPDIPTFTLMVQNKSGQSLDFQPTQIAAYVDGKPCGVYSLEERVAQIHSNKVKKQVALAILGGLAAGASAYAASHSTTTYTSYGHVGRTGFYQTATIRTFDPGAGIFAGAIVAGGTGLAIGQVARNAANEEDAAQGIFQRNTIAPGATVVGQLMLKASATSHIRIDVPVNGHPAEFDFDQIRTTAR